MTTGWAATGLLFALLACRTPSRPSADDSSCGAPVPIAQHEAPRRVVQSWHEGPILDMAMSAKGIVATVGEDGSIRLWDPKNRSLLAITRSAEVPEPFGVSWHGDDELVVGSVAIALDGSLRRKLVTPPMEDYTTRLRLSDEFDGVSRWFELTPNAPAILALRSDMTGTRTLLTYPPELQGKQIVKHASIAGTSADKRLAIAVYHDKWDEGRDGQAIRSVVVAWSLHDRTTWVTSLDGTFEVASLSPDAAHLALATEAGRVVVVTLFDSKTADVDIRNRVEELAWSADGTRLAIAGPKRLTMWEPTTGKTVWSTPIPSRPPLDATFVPTSKVAFSPDGTLVVFLDQDRLQTYDARSGRHQSTLGGAAVRHPTSLRFDGVDRLLAPVGTLRETKQLSIWSLATGQLVDRRELGPEAAHSRALAGTCVVPPNGGAEVCLEGSPEPGQVYLSSSGALVAGMDWDHAAWHAGTADSGYGVWDATTGKRLLRTTIADRRGDHGVAVVYGTLADDGKHAILYYGSSVSVRSVPDDGSVDEILAPGRVRAAAFIASPDRVVLGSDDGQLFIYSKGELVARGTSDGGKIDVIEVERGGTRIATTSEDGAIRIWDQSTATLRATFVEFADDETLAFTPGGAYVGTPEAATRISWVFDHPMEGFRFEQFANAFERPEWIARRLQGEPGDVTADLHRPPRAEVLSSTLASDHAEVRLHVASSTRVDVVRAFVEARPAATSAVCRGQGEVALQVPLLPGLDQVSISAFDDRGLASNPITLGVQHPGATRGDLWVVAVGIDRYAKLPAQLNLHYAVADASGLGAALLATVGPGRPYRAAHVRVLANEQATTSAIRGALDELASMKAEDVAVVFFAGHGVKPNDSAEMVFLTGSAALNIGPLDELSVQAASMKADAVAWTDIGSRLARAKGRVVVLLDACHSGHFSQATLVPNNALAATLANEHRAGVIVFAAAKGRQVSYEPTGTRGLTIAEEPMSVGNEANHGLFTGALIAALAAPETDRNSDGVIELSELVDDVSARVEEATAGAQTPWVARREMFGDFAVAPVAGR